MENPLDSYSPFDNPDAPSEPKKAAVKADSDDMDEELLAYERRLDQLESQINARQTRLTVALETGSLEPPANWPSFYPMFHYDITEVVPNLRHFVNDAIFATCVMAAGFAMNFLSCLFLLGADDAVSSPGSKISLSAIYLFIVTPIALDFVTLGIYRLFKSELSTFPVLKVLISLSVLTAFEGILSLGMESSGSCGFITSLSLFEKGHWFVGIISLIVTGLLGFVCYLHAKLLKGIWQFYRGTAEGENIEDDVKKGFAVMVVDALKSSN